LESTQPEFYKGAEEIIKALGILSHIHTVKEDKIDKQRFKLYSNEFFKL